MKNIFKIFVSVLFLTAIIVINTTYTPNAQAAVVLGNVELNDSDSYLYSGGCFDANLGSFTVDEACVYKYGALAKAGPMIYGSLAAPGGCGAHIRNICPCCNTCDWYRYQCEQLILPTCTFTASSPVFSGDSSTLTWTTVDAISVDIDNGIGPVGLSGDMNVSPTSTTTYTLTATNADGPITCSSTVTIVLPPTGGLIPCGRMADDTTTSWIESDDCTLCHLLLMAQLVIEFLIKISAVIAAFFLAIAGFMYIFAGGRPDKITLAKQILTKTLVGFLIIFVSWIMVDTILTMFGYIDPLGDGNWHVMC